MAVMVNSLGGGGGDFRGPIYIKEVQAPQESGFFDPDSFQEVLVLPGPGRLIQAIATRSQANNSDGTEYSEQLDGIKVKIIPDENESRALVKSWRRDLCSAGGHLAIFSMVASLSFPQVVSSDYTFIRIPDHPTISYGTLMVGTSKAAGTSWHTAVAQGEYLSFPGNVEGRGNYITDDTLTIYQDGLFFDSSLSIYGKWGREFESGFNGVILVYQLFE